MRDVLYSRLVFLDSHDGVKGRSSLRPSFHVPTNAFACGQGESMRLVLKNFTMPKSFYDVNQSNSTFWYRNTDNNTSVKITLEPGDYTASELAAEIQARVRATAGLGGSSFAVSYDAKTRKFTCTIPSNYPSGFFFSVFDKTQPAPEYYQDTSELLGGSPTTSVTAPLNMFDGSTHTLAGSSTIVVSKYPIRLSTLENVYLRCSQQGDAYCSTAFEPNKKGNKLDHCDIWAAIPVTVNSNNTIVLDDNSEDYQIHIKHGQVSDIKFSLSDGKGRALPLAGDDQAVDGNINFKLCFKFEIMSEPHEAHIITGGVDRYMHPPSMTK